MTLMKIAGKFFQEAKNLSYEWKARNAHLEPSVRHNVSYVCQFAQPEHAELSLKNELNPLDDPYWEHTGADSPALYAKWAFTMCGMASTAMALAYFLDKKVLPVPLAENALSAGVYDVEPGGISGMKYREFSNWIGKHGLRAEVYSRLSVRGIEYALSRGHLVIISVNPNIRGYHTAPHNQQGGHLVLATGYDLNTDSITFNNPSGFVSTNSQISHSLPTDEFKKFYAGRGIVLSSLKTEI
jgi:Peptidase_C39 like family